MILNNDQFWQAKMKKEGLFVCNAQTGKISAVKAEFERKNKVIIQIPLTTRTGQKIFEGAYKNARINKKSFSKA